MLKRFKPTLLQGNLDRKQYFEGWFQKVYSADHNASFIIIYGFATGHTADKMGFIQLHIPQHKPQMFTFHKSEIQCDSHQHRVQFRDNIFSKNEIKIHTSEIDLNLSVKANQIKSEYNNTMGNYYLIPNLPCYHAVVEELHHLSGEIRCFDTQYVLSNAKGYLEKNWGISFPDKYIWLHAFDPNNPQNQILFSQADIKWLGKSFLKHVGYIKFLDTTIDLRRLKKCHISYERINDKEESIVITAQSIRIEIVVYLNEKVHFIGPQNGLMNRTIVHFNDVVFLCTLFQNGLKKEFNLIGNFENIKRN